MPGQQLNPVLISDVEVWRAAVGVAPSDRRATGPVQLGDAARTWQKRLETRLRSDVSRVWSNMLADVHPRIREDPFSVALTHHVANLQASGVAIPELLAQAAADGPIPAEHAAAALWWRLSRHLSENDRTGSVPPMPTELEMFIGDTYAGAHEEPVIGGHTRGFPLDLVPSSDNLNRFEIQRATPEQ